MQPNLQIEGGPAQCLGEAGGPVRTNDRQSVFLVFILSSKRLRMTDKTFKNQVFAHCNSHLLNVASRKRKAENFTKTQCNGTD